MKKMSFVLFVLAMLMLFCSCGKAPEGHQYEEDELVIITDSTEETTSVTTETEKNRLVRKESETSKRKQETAPKVPSNTTYTVATETTDKKQWKETTKIAEKKDISTTVSTTGSFKATETTTIQETMIYLDSPGYMYVASGGESLAQIAELYGCDVKYLGRFNSINTTEVLNKGVCVMIPEGYQPRESTTETIQTLEAPPMPEVSDNEVMYDYNAEPTFEIPPVMDSDERVQYGAETKTSWSAGYNSFTNMEIACDVLTNTVAYIPPGGSFSWLNDVGPCTSSPYVISNGYSGGKVVQVYGGGICMTASALKVAAWRAGCIITETHVHGLPVPYNSRDYEGWEDYESTVDASGVDLKFYNPSQTTGLRINAYVDWENCSCTVELIPD